MAAPHRKAELRQLRIRRCAFLAAALLVAVAAPLAAQDRSWQNTWYWGVQGGGYFYNTAGRRVVPTVGGHWFITAGRSALYLAFDQLLLDDVVSTLKTGETLTFGSGQLIQATIYAVPTDGRLQVILGLGFAIHRITDAEPANRPDRPAVENAATQSFLLFSSGLQYRVLGRSMLFAQAQYIFPRDEFIIASQQIAFSIGLRYAVTHAKELVGTER